MSSYSALFHLFDYRLEISDCEPWCHGRIPNPDTDAIAGMDAGPKSSPNPDKF